jgi:Raf kinase inhibitor-like YbhB/YbcL family protein
LMYDRHQIANNWIHWLVIDIPANVNELAEGASLKGMMPNGSIELKNSFQTKGYGGPAPPSGSGTHEYAFVLYAINDDHTNLEPNRNYTYNQVIQELNEDTITTAEISGLFNRDMLNAQNYLWQWLKLKLTR